MYQKKSRTNTLVPLSGSATNLPDAGHEKMWRYPCPISDNNILAAGPTLPKGTDVDPVYTPH